MVRGGDGGVPLLPMSANSLCAMRLMKGRDVSLSNKRRARNGLGVADVSPLSRHATAIIIALLSLSIMAQQR